MLEPQELGFWHRTTVIGTLFKMLEYLICLKRERFRHQWLTWAEIRSIKVKASLDK
jgi:hypothetical protein